MSLVQKVEKRKHLCYKFFMSRKLESEPKDMPDTISLASLQEARQRLLDALENSKDTDTAQPLWRPGNPVVSIAEPNGFFSWDLSNFAPDLMELADQKWRIHEREPFEFLEAEKQHAQIKFMRELRANTYRIWFDRLARRKF